MATRIGGRKSPDTKPNPTKGTAVKKVHTSGWAARCGWALVLAAVCLSAWGVIAPSDHVVTQRLAALACGVAGVALVGLRFAVSIENGRLTFRAYGLRLYSGALTSSTQVDVAPTMHLGTTSVGWRRINASTFAYFGGKGPAISVTFDNGDVVYIRSHDAVDIAESIAGHIGR